MRDPVLDVDVMTLRGIIAAAEERGRRRGVEERDELRRLVRYMRPTYCGATCPVGSLHEATCVDAQAALAPRDSAPQQAVCDCNPPLVDGHWSTCATRKPRDSAPVCDCDSPLFQGSHLASCPKMQPRDSGKEG